MKFHYELEVRKMQEPILHQDKLMLVGSCFTENIGEKLRAHKFSVMENPHGILFNPVSVAAAVTQYVEKTVITADDLFQYNEAWHSWMHHSRFSALTPEAAVTGINASVAGAHAYLAAADHILITLGSAWIYTLTENAQNARPGMVAANNHKAPADWFYKRLMSVEETLSVLDNMLHRLFFFNPKLRIIFTISPVRHLREGMVENNRSKAVLIQAVHHLVNKFEKLYYFPAYELVIDDLRDYRFYAEDLVHPNYHATQYVWEKFTGACMNDETRSVMQELHEIQLAFRHKPFNPSSGQHRKFLDASRQKAMALQAKYPYLDLSEELRYFSA
ncbi:GSCFA domain-containing protein [Sediminibacterium ginsengisoli]|uniref:GSCFA family protein n=1 Tax=Sediminibacterium ginsengisoli TaxID=413434 RepID=A0A1T4L863_9BACT|nr:GSCFA domain-containing protein [Sediminibacterium ginsengisoli]SJZ50909.1 GSCFA family protein [Sediminibacterium ginsengisoli]